MPKVPKVIVNPLESDVSVATAPAGGGGGRVEGEDEVAWAVGSNDMVEDEAGVNKTNLTSG
jgi:hypothetical protein